MLDPPVDLGSERAAAPFNTVVGVVATNAAVPPFALAAAARNHSPRISAVIAMAPHVFAESISRRAVAAVVARELGGELDVMVVRKLGVPGHEELAMGAIASGGIRVMNQDVLDSLAITDEELAGMAESRADIAAGRVHTAAEVRAALGLE